MALRIITDSTCDFSAKQREELGVTALPLSIYFGQEEFKDGVDITPEQFFDKLDKSPELPTTSQVNPAAFEAAFRSACENGDEVVGIFISSKISGTYQSACIARDAINNGRIHIVDSKVATMGLALMVKAACSMRDEGLSAAQVARDLTRMNSKIRFICVVDTLKYLKMGGRISTAMAGIGGLLDIKPVVVMTEGIIKAIDLGKGTKRAIKKLISHVQSETLDTKWGTCVAHSNAPELLIEFEEIIREKLNILNSLRVDLGPGIGVYAGPGCVGVAYFAT